MTAQLLGKVRKGQVWCALLSLSLGLSGALVVETSWLGTSSESTVLADRAIDDALAASPQVGADLQLGSLFYVALVATFLGFYLGLSLLNGWIDRELDEEGVDRAKSGVLLFSQISLALYVLHLIAGDGVPLALRTLTHLLCALPILSMVAKRIVSPRKADAGSWALAWSLLNDDPFMMAALFMPVAAISTVGLAGGRLNPVAGRSIFWVFIVYLLVLSVFLVGYFLAAKRMLDRENGGLALALYDLNTAVVVAGAPLILIPLGLQIANEIQFVVPGSSPRFIGVVVVAILGVASACLFVLQRRGRLKLGAVTMLAGFYFPAMVATMASFRTHLQTLGLGTLDYFSIGKRVLPAQQWSDLGSVPLLDLVPNQGLADFGVQWLFTVFNGVHDLDMLVWLPWIPIVVGFLILYAFLAVVTSPLLAALVVVLLPVKAAVVGQYALALLPAVILITTLKHPTLRRFLILWGTSALLILWRPGLGWPAALALLFVVVWVLLFEDRHIRVQAMTSLALALGLVPTGLLVAEVFWAGDTDVALRGFLDLFVVSGYRGLGSIETSLGVSSFLLQILPVIAVTCLLLFLMRRFVRREILAPSTFGVLYIVIFSLAVPARQGLVAGRQVLDPSLLLLVVALIPFMARQEAFRPRQLGRSTWMMATLVACVLMGPSEIYSLAGSSGAPEELRVWLPDERRVLFDGQPHRALVEFLLQELAEEESFLDFTGSAALYSLTSKRYPLPTITDFRATSESRQRTQIAALQDQIAAGELPLVVFRSSALREGPRLRLPTEVISYRVAEFIYSEYIPWAKVAGWELWRKRGVQRRQPEAPVKAIRTDSIRQNFQLGQMPYRWASEDPWEAVARTEIARPLLDRSAMTRAGLPLQLGWEAAAGSVGSYLHIQARPILGEQSLAGDEQTLTVSYGSPFESSFRFQLAPSTRESQGGESVVELQLRDDPKKHNLERISLSSGRLAFRSTGNDPWIHRFVDLSDMPALETGIEQWMALSYRSTKADEGQLFFAAGDGKFREEHSVKFPLGAVGAEAEPLTVSVPVLGVDAGRRLAKLRFDPPKDSSFEIISLHLLQRQPRSHDYLIRLSTQYQWVTGDIRQLKIEANSPVIVDGVYLRSGD